MWPQREERGMTSATHRKRHNITVAIASLYIAAMVPFALSGTAAASENSSSLRVQFSGSATSIEVENETDVAIANSTSQVALTGSVDISGAKEVSDITTGDASNVNDTTLAATVESDTDVPASSPSSPSGDHHKSSAASSSTKVENKTNIRIANSTNQFSETGSVHIEGARNVQNVRTGDASNDNCTDISVVVAANTLVSSGSGDNCPAATTPDNGDNGTVIDDVLNGGQGGGVVLGTSTSPTQELANTGAEVLLASVAALALIGSVGTVAFATRRS